MMQCMMSYHMITTPFTILGLSALSPHSSSNQLLGWGWYLSHSFAIEQQSSFHAYSSNVYVTCQSLLVSVASISV